jgi:hypothetical protein
VGPVTRRERIALVHALEARAAGDESLATEIELALLDGCAVVDDRRCPECRLWPGQQWMCRRCSGSAA